jgi:hypothetical protein
MNEGRVRSGLEGLASTPRAGQHSSAGSLGRPVSDEGKQIAHAIRLVASPGRNLTRTHDQVLRVVVWIACLLACGLVWTAVAYLAAGAQPW